MLFCKTVFVVKMIVVENVSSLDQFLDAVKRFRRIVVGGDGCVECRVLLHMVTECVDAYVKLSFDLDGDLIDYLFKNNVFGIPFVVVDGEIVYDTNLFRLKKIVCGV